MKDEQDTIREAYCETLRGEYAEKYRQLREEFERQLLARDERSRELEQDVPQYLERIAEGEDSLRKNWELEQTLTKIRHISCGEVQIAVDDTEALGVIYKLCIGQADGVPDIIEAHGVMMRQSHKIEELEQQLQTTQERLAEANQAMTDARIMLESAWQAGYSGTLERRALDFLKEYFAKHSAENTEPR